MPPALHSGLDALLLAESGRRAVRRPGGARARRVVAFADGRSESPGESWSRVEFGRMGKPPSHLQYEVRDERGALIARSDFCWQEERVLGEFDGKIKYGALLQPGEHPSDVVVREKRREDAVRDQGWQVIRWVWSEMRTPAVIAARLDRASARSSRQRN